MMQENSITIEAGPGKHGFSQALFMYMFEPGGNRVELFGDSGYLIFDPAWKPITWREDNVVCFFAPATGGILGFMLTGYAIETFGMTATSVAGALLTLLAIVLVVQVRRAGQQALA